MKHSHAKYYVGIENGAIGLLLFASMLLRTYYLTFWVSIALFAAFFVLLWKNSRILIKYIIVVFSSLQFIGGGILCELFPQYLREIGSDTRYIGAMQPLLFYYWLFFTFIWLMDGKVSNFFQKHVRSFSVSVNGGNLYKTIYKEGYILVFLFNLLLFALVAKRPAFLYGINRMDYGRLYLSNLASKLAIFPLMLCPFVLAFYWKQKNVPTAKIVKRLLIAYLPYVLYGIWTGNKYGFFIEILFCLVMMFYDEIKIKARQILRIFSYLVLISCVLFVFLLIYYLAQGISLIESLSVISNRIVVEGELWWKIFSMSGDGELHLDVWQEELQAVASSILTKGEIKEYGVYHLMELAGVPRIVDEFLNQGIRFAAQGIELPYYCLGFAALFVFPLVMSPLFVIITNAFIHTTKKGLIIAPAVYLRLLILLKGCFRQGDWYLFFTASMAMFCFALFLSIVIRYGRTQKRRIRSKNTLKGSIHG